MNRLKSKVALITGAAQGIGLAIAELMEHEGATVIVTDIQDELGQRELKRFKRARYLHLDVTQEHDWAHAKQVIQRDYQRLDILVNNAGVTGFQENWGAQDPESASLESWNQVHAVNQTGVFLGCKMAIALMKDHGGSIINMSSRSGLVGIPGAAAYASSKASVRNHTKTVALYCAEKGYPIRCNSIHPATILTPMWEPFLGEGQQREQSLAHLASQIPMGRIGTPLDVAQSAVYLASDESSFMTGSEIHLDGGLLAGSAAAPKKVTSR